MDAFELWWLKLPVPVKLAPAILLAFVALLLRGRPDRLWIAPASALALYFAVYAWLDLAPHYRLHKEAWLQATCREVLAGQLETGAEPLAVEGLLITANFDRLVNDRLQRVVAAAAAEQRGGPTIVDTGRYAHHPLMSALDAGSFAANSLKLLEDGRLAYVEFEMVPQAGGEYSNAGMLNTAGWSGKRYRLYYLAPHGHASCVPETGEFGGVGGAVAGIKPVIPVLRPTRPYCLALDITTTPLSRYRVTADEPKETLWGVIRPRGLWLPAWASLRLDRMAVERIDDGAQVRRYIGFDYPSEHARRHACNNRDASSRFVRSAFVANPDRTFLRSRPWYEGSAVQAFYEPEKALAVQLQSTPASETGQVAGTCSPPQRLRRDDRVVLDQLNDFSGLGLSTETTRYQQRASFFALGSAVTISGVEWSGLAVGDEAKQSFLVAIFRDASGLPGDAIYQAEVRPTARMASRWRSHSQPYIFAAEIAKLHLPAGDYWFMVSRPAGVDKAFFWTVEPGVADAACGSGSAYRSGTDAWRQLDSSVPARRARGFSFRLLTTKS